MSKRIRENDLIRTVFNADRMSKAICRTVEDVHNILGRIRNKAPATAWREAHALNARLCLNTGSDLVASRIDHGDNSVHGVHNIECVAERRERQRISSRTRLDIFNLLEFLNVDH